MTPEQRSVNNDWQGSVGRFSLGDSAAEEDTVVSESPPPSAHSDEALLQDDNAEVVSDRNVACAMSAPMPMGPYRPSKPAGSRISDSSADDAEDDEGWCVSCLYSLLGCWNMCCWGRGCTSCMCGKPEAT